MSLDSCSMTISCRKADLDKALANWRDTLSCEASADAKNPEVLSLEFDEVGYADPMENEGFPSIPFVAEHRRGGTFDAGALVFDGKTKFVVSATDEGYSFQVDDDGNPVVDDTFRAFWAAKKRVEAYIATGKWPEASSRTHRRKR